MYKNPNVRFMFQKVVLGSILGGGGGGGGSYVIQY